MASVSVTEQTRLQVERAQRVAEEARGRIRAARGGSLRLGEDSEHPPPELDDEQAVDHCAD